MLAQSNINRIIFVLNLAKMVLRLIWKNKYGRRTRKIF